MKKLSLVFAALFIMSLFSSCKKEGFDISSYIKKQPQEEQLPTPQKEDWKIWCKSKLAAWGDSQTADIGLSNWQYVWVLADNLGIDSIIFKPYNYGQYLYHSDSMVYNGGVSGETSVQIAKRMLADTIHNSWATVIDAGRNDYWHTDDVITSIRAMVAHLKTDKFVVLSITPGDYVNEYKGQDGANQIIKINGLLKDEYKDHYLDLMPKLSKVGSQPTAGYEIADSLSIVRGIPLASYRADQLHYNAYARIEVANAISEYLIKCK